MGLLDIYKPHAPGLLDFIIGGQNRVDSLTDRQRQLQQQGLLDADIGALTPDQRVAARLNPGKFGEALASQNEAYTLPEGAVRGIGSNLIAGAPKVSWQGDQAFSANPLTGAVTNIGSRGPSYAEQTERAKAETDAKMAERKQWLAEVSQGLPPGFHLDIGPDGKPVWTIDPAYKALEATRHPGRAAGGGGGGVTGLPPGYVPR